MIAVICAAGEGKRLKPYTDNCPKCLIKIGEKTIIEYMLDNISKAGINNVIIVIGYKKNEVINKIGYKYKNCNIRYVINDNYSNTNNMYSLWLAMKHINEDIVFFNADILFNVSILKDVLNPKYENMIAVSSEIKEDSMRVVIEDNLIKKLGKGINDNFSGDAIGIYKISRKTSKEYFTIASKFISEGKINISFVEPINSLANKIHFNPVYAKNNKCAEIDNLEDYENVKKFLADIIALAK